MWDTIITINIWLHGWGSYTLISHLVKNIFEGKQHHVGKMGTSFGEAYYYKCILQSTFVSA